MHTRLLIVALAAACLTAATSLRADEGDAERCIPAEMEQRLLGTAEAIAARYKRARSLHDADHFAEAAVLFRDIAFEHPAHELAVPAANLYLDSLNALGSMVERPNPSCYDDLAAAVGVLVDESQPPGAILLRDAELRRTTRALRVGLLRKAAESLTQRKLYAEAAAIYLGIERDFDEAHDETDRCEVLFNASIVLEQARLAGLAIRVRERLIERYPACGLAGKTSLYLAHTYQALNMHREALERYEDYAAKYSKEREATDALLNAFELRLAFGELDAAARNLQLFERNYARREPGEAAALALHFGLVLLEAGHHRRAREQLESCLKRYDRVIGLADRIRAEVALADTHYEQPRPDRRAALAGYARAVGHADRGPRDSWDQAGARTALAKARYRLALVEYEKLAAIELPAFRPRKRVPAKIARWWKGRRREAEPDMIQFEYWSQHQFRDWLARQSAALRAATDALREVAALRSPEWTIAAAARLGDAHARFAETLETIVPPPSLAREERLAKVFRGAMQPHVQQPRQLAFQSYEHCHRLALDAGSDSPDARHCRQRLTELDPERHPPLDELRPTPDAGEPDVLPLPGAILERADPDARRRRPALSPAQREAIERYGDLLGGREPLAGLGEAELADP